MGLIHLSRTAGHDLYSDDVPGVNFCKEASFLRIHEPRGTHTDSGAAISFNCALACQMNVVSIQKLCTTIGDRVHADYLYRDIQLAPPEFRVDSTTPLTKLERAIFGSSCRDRARAHPMCASCTYDDFI